MLVIMALVGVLLVALGISVWIFYRLKEESRLAEEKAAVPVADINAPPVDDVRCIALEDELRVLKEALIAAQVRIKELEASAVDVGSNGPDRDTANSFERQDDGSSHLRAENSAFKVQLEESAAAVCRLKEVILRLQEDIAGLRSSSVAVLDAQKVVETARGEHQRRLEDVYREMEDLRAENMSLQAKAAAGEGAALLRHSADELAVQVRELEVVKAIQSEKNEYLQYELTKARAQVIGLERLCENVTTARSPFGEEAGVAGR